jgi:hypothetical protein
MEMAHPDKTRGGSEKGQRLHAGQTSRYSDAGMQAKSQHGQRGGEATLASTAPQTPPQSSGTPPLKGKTSKVARRSPK